MSAVPALQARGLRVALGGRTVLQGVDLSIVAGGWTAVAGPNGAGKTTLLKALARLLPIDGQVDWQGRDSQRIPARARGRLLAWLGQGDGGGQDLRAHDLVMLGRLPHRGWLEEPGPADFQAVRAAMERTGSWGWRERPLGQLSGGERQRVLLARALAVGAPLLLMDEPLSHLDPPHQADWLAIVREHVQDGGTAVTVLHEINMALHADRLLLVRAGRVVHHGDTREAGTHRALEAVFDQRIAVHPVGRAWVALPVDDLPEA